MGKGLLKRIQEKQEGFVDTETQPQHQRVAPRFASNGAGCRRCNQAPQDNGPLCNDCYTYMVRRVQEEAMQLNLSF